MSRSKVYFSDMHTTVSMNLRAKLERLMKSAGFESIDFSGKFVAVKVNFGEGKPRISSPQLCPVYLRLYQGAGRPAVCD